MEGKRNNMDIKNILIDEIIIDKKNSISDTNQFLYNKLKQFIKKFGQIQVVTVCKNEKGYELIDGYYIYKAMNELGHKNIEVNDLGDMEESDKLLFIIGMKSKFEKDLVKISRKFRDLIDLIEIEEIECFLPYDKEEIKYFPGLLDFDFRKYDENSYSNLYLENNEEYF